MIGPTPDFLLLERLANRDHNDPHVWISGREATARGMFLPNHQARQNRIDQQVARWGLYVQDQQLVGAQLVIPCGPGMELRLGRSHLYSAVAPHEFMLAIDRHVARIAEHGPGEVWSLGSALVSAIVDENDTVRCIPQAGGDPLIVVRTFYGHIKQATRYKRGPRGFELADPLDLEIDRVRLRDLLARDESSRREEKGRHSWDFTPAQRNAIAEHHRAALRAMVRRSDHERAERDRLQVVVDQDLD